MYKQENVLSAWLGLLEIVVKLVLLATLVPAATFVTQQKCIIALLYLLAAAFLASVLKTARVLIVPVMVTMTRVLQIDVPTISVSVKLATPVLLVKIVTLIIIRWSTTLPTLSVVINVQINAINVQLLVLLVYVSVQEILRSLLGIFSLPGFVYNVTADTCQQTESPSMSPTTLAPSVSPSVAVDPCANKTDDYVGDQGKCDLWELDSYCTG
jgi:hypothetical protein